MISTKIGRPQEEWIRKRGTVGKEVGESENREKMRRKLMVFYKIYMNFDNHNFPENFSIK